MPLTRSLCLFFATIALAGCGAPRQTTTPSEPQILGGSPLSAGWSFAEATVTIGTESQLAQGRGTCSGVSLGEGFVLTAAHCVVDVYHRPLTAEPLFVRFEGTQSGTAFRVALWNEHCYANLIRASEESPEKPPNDLALLLLQSPMPSDLPSISLPSTGLTARENVVASGFGRSVPDAVSSAGRLLAVSMTVDSADSRAKRASISAARRGEGVCHGDSGGPVFVERPGGWELGGILSGGPTDRNNLCQGPGRATQVFDYLSWINETRSNLSRRAHREP